MKSLVSIFLLLCISSCDYFDKKKVYSKDIIEEELQTFNWEEVDEYPNFLSCSSIQTKLKRQNCFQTTITQQITEYLSKEMVVVTQEVNDTVHINFLISDKGNISIQNIKSDSLTKTQIPDIDQLLSSSLEHLPEIFPAIKRGQQVKTEFILPVVIKVN